MHPRISIVVMPALVLSLLAATVSCADPAAEAATDAKQSMRVTYDRQGEPVAMETSIARFVPAGDDLPGLSVDLISAVHIGEKEYYEALNKRFEQYDVVLYELIAAEGTRIPKGGGKQQGNMLAAVQTGLKDLLGLEYQLAGIDYTKGNLVRADLTPEEFAKSMEQRGESVWSMLLRMMSAGMAQQANPTGRTSDMDLILALFDRDRAGRLKRVLAEQFLQMDQFTEAFNGPDGSTIITERNKAALRGLKREIDNGQKKIAIFYGGAHMSDIEQRLAADFDLKPAGREWIEAWNLRAK